VSGIRWPEPPAGFVVRASGGRALYVAEPLEADLRSRGLHEWEAWDRALAAGMTSSGRGATALVSGASGRLWRLKTMRRGGILGRLWRDRYPSAVRLVATLTASEEARARGIPTARPVALIVEVESGGLARGSMAFEEIEGAEDLARHVRREAATRADLSAALGAVRSMHDRGVHHADLNLGNILLRAGPREAPEAFVIDFDRAVVGPSPRPFADRQAALRRLERSCAKLTGAPGPFGPGSEDVWYSIYAGDDAGLASRLARGRPAGRLALAVHRMGWRRSTP
jgi:3-deoxy-D-manno-octulosonic acid kinase